MCIRDRRYSCTIGRRGIFSLGRWSSRIPARFLVPGRTWGSGAERDSCHVRDSHPLWWDFPVAFHYDSLCSLCRLCTTPAPQPLASVSYTHLTLPTSDLV